MISSLNPRLRAAVLALLAVLLIGGVAAECSDGGKGMYQGPGDSQPRWR